MSMISEQVKELKRLAEHHRDLAADYFTAISLSEAADTIEALSAKLAAANMERSERYYWLNEIIERLEFEEDKANDDCAACCSNVEDMHYYDGKEDGIHLAIDLIKSYQQKE